MLPEKTPLNQVQEAHLKTKPVRPQARTCSQEEWSTYSRDYDAWDKKMTELVIEMHKAAIQKSIKIPASSFGRLNIRS